MLLWTFSMDNGCPVINDITLFDKRLEKVLSQHPDSLMIHMKPTHFLIGSAAESTRLGYPSEIDVTNKLEGLSADFFKVTKWNLELTDQGKQYFGTQIEKC